LFSVVSEVLATSIIRAFSDPLIMKAARTSETSVNFYQTTQRNNPGDSHLHTRRRENLKPYFGVIFPFVYFVAV
jgi:hypothetical protein